MPKLCVLLLLLVSSSCFLYAQESDVSQIERTCMNCLEGFYYGDSSKIIGSIKPTLYKFGYWRRKGTDAYVGDGHMTFKQAVAYANNVQRNKSFAKPDAPKHVEVLDISNHLAAVKITARWGIDYALLSRHGDGWLIEEVLWEGPLDRKKDSLTISYVGNMGVLISSNNQVVIIDGFHKEYKPAYAYPSEQTVQEIISGAYKKVGAPDVALVTHHHRDHFDADYVSLFLQRNPASRFIAPPQASELVRDHLSDESKSHHALIAVPYNDDKFAVSHRGIEILAFKCPHVNAERHSSVQNMAYLIHIGDYSVLHVGDSHWDMAEDLFKEKQIVRESIDVAILPYWMLLDDHSKERVTSLLGAKQIMATHIPPDFSEVTYRQLREMHPTITLFTRLNEQRVFK